MGLIDTEEEARAVANTALLDVQRDNEYLIAGRKSDLALILHTELSYARAFYQERVAPNLHWVFESLLTEPPFAHVPQLRPWAVSAPALAPSPPASAQGSPPPHTAPPHAHVCSNCGAPMPIAASNTIQHCRFCEAETRER
jgi:hypothetical protein